LLPFSLLLRSEGAATLVNASKRWRVGAVRPDGDKVGDPVLVETTGRAGYIVKKGQRTRALLAEPGTGMIHSTPRN
jgi:hypothetical protein